jgi:hypothetical protein
VQQYDGTGAAVEPEPPAPPADIDPGQGLDPGPEPGPVIEPPQPLIPPRGPRRLAWAIGLFVALVVALALGILLALLAKNVLLGDDSDTSQRPSPSHLPTPGVSVSNHANPSKARDQAVRDLLAQRSQAVTSGDRAQFLATVDPAAADFYAAQAALVDRLGALQFADWSYELTGDGPGFTPDQARVLPDRSAIVRVRLTYRLVGTTTSTDREQYLTVVPRGDRWLVASDTDASASGLDTQRDLWDLGPVRTLRGDTSLVVADRRGATVAEMQKLADEADLAVHDVDEVWTGEWSHQPLVLLPRNQADMATIIDSDGAGLAQIAAVTTGAFESGLSRGDRIVINPASWKTLDALGRRVVLTHEMTHVATRSSSVQSVPIWLSEGFADYVAYRATPVPTAIVASDVFRKVRAGKAPDHLPDSADFDAARGDIASSYEGAWLACRMISEQYGEKKLVRLYSALSDSAGPGWPDETVDVLGVGRRELVHDWKAYLRDRAAR